MTSRTNTSGTVVWLRDIPTDAAQAANQLARVGGKAWGLAQLIHHNLNTVRVPHGFVIPADIFVMYREHSPGAGTPAGAPAQLRTWWQSVSLDDQLIQDITTAYTTLGAPRVAVRSSGTAEDLPGASFAGQHDSFTDITTLEQVLQAVKNCWASLYTDRACAYRAQHHLSDDDVAMAVIVQEQVDTRAGASGVAFTLDPESGNRHLWTVQAVWGSGDQLVQGSVNPQEYLLSADTVARNVQAGTPLFDPGIAHPYTDKPALTNTQLHDLATAMYQLQNHYPSHGLDIEWAHAGPSEPVYLVQMRPETVHTHQTTGTFCTLDSTPAADTLVAQGVGVGSGVVQGILVPVQHPQDTHTIPPEAIIIADMTTPDWMPVLRKVRGLVTRLGGRTCHAAIVTRELGIPAVIGIGDSDVRAIYNKPVTLEVSPPVGRLWTGRVPYSCTPVNFVRPVGMKGIYLNVSDEREALARSVMDIDGIGLFRLEFLYARMGVHPAAVELPEKIQELSRELTRSVACTLAAWYPRPVVVRLGDFKSNEYRLLAGGAQREPLEENPMIGLRGAARYRDPAFRAAWDLEVQALARVRAVHGLDNMVVMIPFVRTVDEVLAVKQLLHEVPGLMTTPGLSPTPLYIMVEVPSCALTIEEFLPHVDGVSIGSNDLTQLTLGIDRDNTSLDYLFDEQHPAVQYLVERVIRACVQHKRPVSLCGQAPSDIPGYADWLRSLGITGVSYNTDAIDRLYRIGD